MLQSKNPYIIIMLCHILMTETDQKVKKQTKKNNSHGTVTWISTATSIQCDKGGYKICTIYVTASRK